MFLELPSGKDLAKMLYGWNFGLYCGQRYHISEDLFWLCKCYQVARTLLIVILRLTSLLRRTLKCAVGTESQAISKMHDERISLQCKRKECAVEQQSNYKSREEGCFHSECRT